MKKFVFIGLLVAIVMACTDRNPLVGRWAMIMEESEAGTAAMLRDTLVSTELRFDRDSVYMEVWSDAMKVKTETMGIYAIEGDRIIVTDRYGNQRTNKFAIEKDTLIVMDKDIPNKVIMRLIRIKGD